MPPASYAFAQQYNSACHIMNFMNLEILMELRKRKAGSDIDLATDATWRTRREWFPITTRALASWQKAMNDLDKANGPFKKMVEQQMKEGILNGHLHWHNGKRYDDVLNPITQKIRMLQMPFNFTDATKLPYELAQHHQAEAYAAIPVFAHDGKFVAFDPESNDYVEMIEVRGRGDIADKKWDIALAIGEPLPLKDEDTLTQPAVTTAQPTSTNQVTEPSGQTASSVQGTQVATVIREPEESTNPLLEAVGAFGVGLGALETPASEFQYDVQSYFESIADDTRLSAHFRYFKLSPGQKKLLQLPDNAFCYRYNNDMLGFDRGYCYRYLPHIAERHSYYMSSLNQLTLFALGLDNDLKTIDRDHPLYAAHQEFKAQMDKYEDNPWQNDSFHKDNFLEYHLAKMIENDPALKKQMIDTVEVLFPNWSLRQKLNELLYQNEDGTLTPAKDRAQHLLGDNAYLAYCFVQSLRFVWASANSKQAFNSILELDPISATLLSLPGMPGPNQILRRAQQKVANRSFLDVWGSIRERLAKNPDVPKDIASFSSHGVLVSFSPDMVKAQNDNGVRNTQVMNKLGFAIIDSYYGNGLKPMYRTENAIPKAATPTHTKAPDDLKTQLEKAIASGESITTIDQVLENLSFNETNRTASDILCWAVKQRHKKIVEKLIAKGAKVNVKDEDGKSPLALSVLSNQHEITKLLISKKADVNVLTNKQSLLELALSVGNNIDFINLFKKCSHKLPQEAFLLAAIQGNTAVVSVLHKARYDINYKDATGNTPLKQAVRSKNIDFALAAIEHNAKIDLEQHEIASLAASAIEQKRLYAALKLIAKLDNVNSVVNDHKDTLLTLAAKYKNRDDILLALIKKGADVTYANLNKDTALTLAAEHCHVDVATALITKGASVDAPDGYDKSTPFMKAAHSGNVPVMKVLLANGAKIDLIDKHHNSALVLAALSDHPDAVQLIIDKKREAGQDVTSELTQALVRIAPWHWQGSQTIALLVNNGAQINQMVDGTTAFHEALREPNMPVIEQLVSLGADVNLQDSHGKSPLKRALRFVMEDPMGYVAEDIIPFLLNNGADIHAKSNKEKESPLDYAKRLNRQDIVEMMQKHDKRASQEINQKKSKPIQFSKTDSVRKRDLDNVVGELKERNKNKKPPKNIHKS